MINIYAANFTDENGVYQTSWTLIQSIPAQSQSDIALVNPTVSMQIDSAETMNFSVYADTKYYNAFKQLTSYIRVDYDGRTIFYGRVLTIDTGYYGERKIQCEGALAFLNDTYYEGKAETKRTSTSLSEFLSSVITNHNNNTGDSFKQIYLGEVPGNYSNAISSEQRVTAEDRKFGESSWTTSKSVLENLKSHHGGYFKTHYSNGHIYLDWLKHYNSSTAINQTVAIGKNVIDLNYITEVNNIFTAIIPFGKVAKSGADPITIQGYRTDVHGSNNYLRVDQITQLYTDEQLNSGYHRADDYRYSVNNYGLIFKTVEIQEASTQASLFTKAAEWIKDNYFGGIDSFTVSAVDMHLIGENEQAISIGDRVTVQYIDDTTTSRVLTCTSIQMDLYNPEKNRYSFGIPSTSLNKNYSVTSKKSKSTPSASSKYDFPKDTEPDPQKQWENQVCSWLMNNQVWKKSNGGSQGGPNSTRMENLFLRPHPEVDEEGVSKWYLWKPRVLTVQNGIILWARDGQGHPTGQWLVYKESDVVTRTIRNHYLIDYVYEEYGINLSKSGSVSGITVDMPSIINNDDGTASILSTLGDGETNPLIQKILDFSKDGNIMSFFDSVGEGGETLAAWIDELGNYHYYKKNDDGTIKTDDQGNPIEVSINAIDDNVTTINADLTDAELLLAEHGRTITSIGSDVVVIGGHLTEAQAELAAQGQQILVINRDLTSISSDVANLTVDVNGVATKVQRKNRVFVQYTDPANEQANLPIDTGDLWIESNSTRTWSDFGTDVWENRSTYNWSEYLGSKTHVWRNDHWEDCGNEAQDVENTTRIEQDDKRITLWARATEVVDGKVQQYRSEFNVTAREISSKVENYHDGLVSSISQTATQIRAEVQNTKEGLESSLTITAGEIRSEVSDSVNGLSSRITQNAGRIELVVGVNEGQPYIKPASIVAAINDGASSVVISADHIDLDGYVKATDLTTTWLSTKIAAISNLSVNNVTAASVSVLVGQGQTTSPVATQTYVSGCPYDLRITSSGNTYTLQWKRLGGSASWSDVGSFSRATSLSGSWSGNTYTVTASPQGNSISTQTYVSTPTWGTGDDKYKATVSFYYFNNGTQTEILPATINTSSKLQSKTFTTTGTKTPDDGYIGFSQVVISLPTYTSYSMYCTRTQSSDGYHYTFTVGTGWNAPFGTGGSNYTLYKRN